MKISISKTELLKLLTEHFNFSVTDVSINKEPSTLAQNILREMEKELGDSNVTKPDRKILAIKAIRTILSNRGTFMRLAEAKWVIENWHQWIEFVKKYNRIPVINNVYSALGATLS